MTIVRDVQPFDLHQLTILNYFEEFRYPEVYCFMTPLKIERVHNSLKTDYFLWDHQNALEFKKPTYQWKDKNSAKNMIFELLFRKIHSNWQRKHPQFINFYFLLFFTLTFTHNFQTLKCTPDNFTYMWMKEIIQLCDY